MSSPPIALGRSAVPAASNLFNLAAANQPRWDWLLFSCCPHGQLRDRFCQELRDFCPQDLTSSVCATTALPGLCQVSIVWSRGDIWGGGDIWGMLVASEVRCVWFFGLIVDAFSANFSGGTFASLLCWRQWCHSGIQPCGRPGLCPQRDFLHLFV